MFLTAAFKYFLRHQFSCYRFSTNKNMLPDRSNWLKKQLGRLESHLQSHYPKTYQFEQTVRKGSEACYDDFKEYYKVQRQIKHGKSLTEFSMKELHNLMMTPTDLVKTVIIVVLLVGPLTLPVLALAILLVPKLILTRHFWDNPQLVQYMHQQVQRRRWNHPFVLLQLKQALQKSDSTGCLELTQKLSTKQKILLLDQIQYFDALNHRSVDLAQLTFVHKVLLCRSHGHFSLMNLNETLQNRAMLLRTVDQNLMRETNLEKMTDEDLNVCLFVRQIDPKLLATKPEKLAFLKKWISFTSSGYRSDSWLLHAKMIDGT